MVGRIWVRGVNGKTLKFSINLRPSRRNIFVELKVRRSGSPSSTRTNHRSLHRGAHAPCLRPTSSVRSFAEDGVHLELPVSRAASRIKSQGRNNLTVPVRMVGQDEAILVKLAVRLHREANRFFFIEVW